MASRALASLLVAAAACSPAAPLPTIPAAVEVIPVAAADGGAPKEAAEPEAGADEPSPAERALREWSPRSACASFDYFPNGGIRSFFCHRPARLGLAAVRALAGTPVFASGPHGPDDLVLDSRDTFGHYDPAFVKWLVDVAGPSPRGSAAQQATQAAYDANLRPLAEVFWRTLAKIEADGACFEREKKAYAGLLAKKKLPPSYYERWFFFMNPYFCSRPAGGNDSFYYDNGFDAGVSGNVTKTVVGFWIRRALDGTMQGFAEGLRKLVASYQPELREEAYQPADPRELSRALDAGARAAAACRDPSAPSPAAHVYVTFEPDGTATARIATAALRASPAASCLEGAFAAQRVPPFQGAALRFARNVKVR